MLSTRRLISCFFFLFPVGCTCLNKEIKTQKAIRTSDRETTRRRTHVLNEFLKAPVTRMYSQSKKTILDPLTATILRVRVPSFRSRSRYLLGASLFLYSRCLLSLCISWIDLSAKRSVSKYLSQPRVTPLTQDPRIAYSECFLKVFFLFFII